MKLLTFVQIFFMHSHIENYSCKSFSLVHQISYTVTDLVRAKKASICFLFFKNIQTLTQTYLYTYTFQYIHRLFGVFFTHAGLMINSYSTYDLILLPFFLESLPDYLHFQPFPFSFSPPTFISVSLFVTVPTPFQLQLPISPLSLSRCNDDIVMKHISQ